MLIWYIQPTLLGAIPYHAISSRSPPATPSGSERWQWWCCQHRSVQSPSAAASPTRPVPYASYAGWFPKSAQMERKTAQKAHVTSSWGFLQFSCLTVMSQTGKSHDSLEPYASPPVPSCSTKSKRSCNVASRIDIQKEFGTIFAGLESLESVKRSNIGSPPVNLVNYHLCESHPSFFMQIIFPHFPRVFPHLFGDLWSSWPGRSWSLRAISNWIWLGCRTPNGCEDGRRAWEINMCCLLWPSNGKSWGMLPWVPLGF